MKIIIDNPPNIEKIRATFDLSGKEIFTWGDKIYNPANVHVDAELLAHELVHEKQQSTNEEAIKVWWDRYLIDNEFRYQQELEAHRVEYRTFCKNNKDRNQRTRYLRQIAIRLASATYGNMVSVTQALRAISNA